MCAPDFHYYAGEYGGTLPESIYEDGIAEAESFVKHLVGWNPVDTDERREAYKRACCAAVETFAVYGDGALGGFHIGNFSTTQTATTGSMSARDVAAQKVRGELLASGLLWTGIA